MVDFKPAIAHLTKHDPILAAVIAASPSPGFTPHQDYYHALTASIIGQQLSVKAAASITKRFIDLFGGTFPDPQRILLQDTDTLRSVGLSRAKALYVQDLARHIQDGTVQFDTIDQQTNQEIISELTKVKGIGEWTAHMFLLFCMGRLDVLPVGDLGIKNGIKQLYGLEVLPTSDDIRSIATKYSWHPYESVASWYIWRSLGTTPS